MDPAFLPVPSQQLEGQQSPAVAIVSPPKVWTSNRQPGMVYIPEKKTGSGIGKSKSKLKSLFGKKEEYNNVALAPNVVIVPSSKSISVSPTSQQHPQNVYQMQAYPPQVGMSPPTPSFSPMGPPPVLPSRPNVTGVVSSAPLAPLPGPYPAPYSGLSHSPAPIPPRPPKPSLSSPSPSAVGLENAVPQQPLSTHERQKLVSDLAASLITQNQRPIPEHAELRPSSFQVQKIEAKVDMKAMEQAIRTANETRDAGIASLEALSLQAEILDGTEANIEAIHLQLERAKVQMNSAKGLYGRALNMVIPSNAGKQNDLAWQLAHERPDRILTIEDHSNGMGSIDGLTIGSQGLASSVDSVPVDGSALPGDSLKQQLAMQDQTLLMLSKMMGDLQNIAGTMSNEISRQNEQSENISERTMKAVSRTHEANYKIDSMI